MRTTTLSCTIRENHYYNDPKSHLGWVASFVPNQRLKYKIVDLAWSVFFVGLTMMAGSELHDNLFHIHTRAIPVKET